MGGQLARSRGSVIAVAGPQFAEAFDTDMHGPFPKTQARGVLRC